MENIVLSIIIPCYNQGHFIKDALENLNEFSRNVIEIIIVNDGSTDKNTTDIIDSLASNGYIVINQENAGLGSARNAGIRRARGRYILPLDADNKILPTYVYRAIEILNNNEAIAVVYGNAQYFGDKDGILKPGIFNLQRLMMGNYIDACAVIRKSVFEKVGFYDSMKIMGLEDWDLWLRLAFAGYEFKYIDEVLFYYRVSKSSMMNSVNNNLQKQNALEKYFRDKYSDKLDFDYVQDMVLYRLKKNPISFLYQLFLKKFFPRYMEKQIIENKMPRGHLHGRI